MNGTFLLVLKHAGHSAAPGPLHLLCPLLWDAFPQRPHFLITLYETFLPRATPSKSPSPLTGKVHLPSLLFPPRVHFEIYF